MSKTKECVLEDRPCTECGECNICDLDRSKICDNCGECIKEEADFKAIAIDDILQLEEEVGPGK